jgi:hypothetical protein
VIDDERRVRQTGFRLSFGCHIPVAAAARISPPTWSEWAVKFSADITANVLLETCHRCR